MTIRLMFLGKLEDAAGAAERSVAPAATLADLLAALEPDLARALGEERIRLARNGTMAAKRGDLALADGDELAFLPPVSGG